MKPCLPALFAAVCSGIALSCAAAPPAPQVHSLARDFADYWNATQGMPVAERVSGFKQTIGPLFPQFYGIARYDGKRTQVQQDAVIARALARFGPERAAYMATVARFDVDLPRYMASFQLAFPDFVPRTPIYFLNSLNEMDGGLREFDGQRYLIFGADVMSRLRAGGNQAAFFHHELFHTYHPFASAHCPQQGMWQPLWGEGLAVYVSKVLNPAATQAELLLDFPVGTLAATKRQLPQAWRQLAKVLDVDDDRLYGPLFSTGKDATGLAPRRGYYLGYLVASELGKTRDLATLANMGCGEAHELVVATVRSMASNSDARGASLSSN